MERHSGQGPADRGNTRRAHLPVRRPGSYGGCLTYRRIRGELGENFQVDLSLVKSWQEPEFGNAKTRIFLFPATEGLLRDADLAGSATGRHNSACFSSATICSEQLWVYRGELGEVV